MADIDTDWDTTSDGLLLLAIILLSFGLGLNWGRYTEQGNWLPILAYGAFLFYGFVHFLKRQ